MSDSLDRAGLPRSTQEELQRIISKGPKAINDEERSFLVARRSYLTPAELDAFEIEEPKKAKSDESEESDEKPKAKKGKKDETE